jgi:transposase-like protein
LSSKERGVITMAMMGKIRSMHFRQGKSISEIARLTSLSRNTIKKWLKAPQGAEPKYRRRGMPTKLAPFVEALDKALKADGHRPRHERRTARALHAELQALGYEGGYTRLTDYLRAWRDEVSVRRTRLDDRRAVQAELAAGCQRCGSNSPMRLAGCVGSRSSTSFR